MRTIKRSLILLLMALLVLAAITGCSSNNDNAAETPDETTPEAPVEATEDETATFDPSEGIDSNGRWEGIRALDLVQLGDYAGIVIPETVHTVTDEAMANEIEALISYYITSEKRTEGVIEDGDTVHMDFVGTVDGVEFEGGSTNGNGTAVVVGETAYVDDFIEQLVGHSPGDRFDVEVTFPEDYFSEELQGKDAVFDVTINYLIETVTPEWTDEFVATNLMETYGASNVAEMEDYIRKTLSEIETMDYLQQYLLDEYETTEIPEVMITYQQNYLLDHFEVTAATNGLSLDDYLATVADLSSREELLDLYVEEIAQAASEDLIIQAIAEDASIDVTDEDVAAYFRDYVGLEDYSEYEAVYGMPYLKMTILKQRVLNHLLESVVYE